MKNRKNQPASQPAHRKEGNRVLLWMRIVRPQTLFASLCPVLVGLLVAGKNIGYAGINGHTTAVLTVVCALALQILSNLINDYYDFRRGTDKKGRVGFSRALAEGQVTEQQMRVACFVALGVAVVTGAVLCYVGGWVILAIGVTAIFFAWLYTATDYSLSYLGIADIFVFLYYGVIATTGTVWLQQKAVGIDLQWANISQLLPAFYAGAVCGLISICVLAINNIRDIDGDCESGKKTFPVRFGKTAALVCLGVIVALMPLFAWLAFGLGWAMLIIIPAAYLYYKVLRAKGAEYNKCLLGAGLVNLCYVLLVWLSV
ncbi:MAG: 1,4-dihydroxy-2-naphthoate octaprenyltransferase [Paludibacteraceae bacterium]|nr:1,4-dihydroxy-2-naphthoate octaprenyltransferase [Paludibacteraceae bacterium]